MSLATSEAPHTSFDEETPHILIVDDDRRIRELLKKYLSENGYRVATAESAAEARARMAGIAFDLLVLDVMMPGETGLELTKSLRLDSSVPILLLTARAET
ncbi:MAG: response regulator, partial [Nitratireductor sp.]